MNAIATQKITAKQIATIAHDHWFKDHLSTFEDDDGTFSIFANIGNDQRSADLAGYLRGRLHLCGVAVLDFARDPSKYSWAMSTDSRDADLIRTVLSELVAIYRGRPLATPKLAVAG